MSERINWQLTEEQIEELGEKHQQLLKDQGCMVVSPTPPHMRESQVKPEIKQSPNNLKFFRKFGFYPSSDEEFYSNRDNN